jgi:hypothetical protein
MKNRANITAIALPKVNGYRIQVADAAKIRQQLR